MEGHMKKYIIMLFAAAIFFVATPVQAFDFSKQTKDTLMKGNKYKSPLGNPLLGDTGGSQDKTKKKTTTTKKKTTASERRQQILQKLR